MMHKLISYYGFSRMPFGRDLAPGMLHRHTAHNEAVARIGWCIAERRIGVITGEVGAGKTVAVRAATAALDRIPARRHLPAQPDGRRARHAPPHRRRARRAHAEALYTPPWPRRPPTRSPPNTPNGAAPPSSWSTRRTCSTTSSSKRSGCSPTTTWTY